MIAAHVKQTSSGAPPQGQIRAHEGDIDGFGTGDVAVLFARSSPTTQPKPPLQQSLLPRIPPTPEIARQQFADRLFDGGVAVGFEEDVVDQVGLVEAFDEGVHGVETQGVGRVVGAVEFRVAFGAAFQP